MRELILFSIDKNHFAIDLDKIKRIVQAESTTPVAGNAAQIEGVFTFENSVINVLSFREMIGLPDHAKHLQELFPKLKNAHDAWYESLKDSIQNGTEFTKPINHYECELGKWISSFNSYDSTVTKIMDILFPLHASFHGSATKLLRLAKSSKENALKELESTVLPLREEIKSLLDELLKNADLIRNSMQKFIILDGEKLFCVRIDEIDDIISIDENDIQVSSDKTIDENIIQIDGIFEYKETLVNLIQTINLPALKD